MARWWRSSQEPHKEEVGHGDDMGGGVVKINRGAPDRVTMATVFLHVTRGLPFVILCLRIYEGGWEGKGTFNCHHWHLF